VNIEELARRIAFIAAAVCDHPEDLISSETRLREDLGCDDIDILEIVIQAEEVADLELDDSDVESARTVSDLVSAFARRLTAEAA
jgi:acyl carrier protein